MEKENREVTPKRKAWYQLKIEELEAKVEKLSSLNLTSTNGAAVIPTEFAARVMNYNEAYADGYVDCMHKYGIMSKVIRRRTHENIALQGPGAIKGSKRTNISFVVP